MEGGDLFQYCSENGPLPEDTARRQAALFSAVPDSLTS